jgi:hypothetical protein
MKLKDVSPGKRPFQGDWGRRSPEELLVGRGRDHRRRRHGTRLAEAHDRPCRYPRTSGLGTRHSATGRRQQCARKIIDRGVAREHLDRIEPGYCAPSATPRARRWGEGGKEDGVVEDVGSRDHLLSAPQPEKPALRGCGIGGGDVHQGRFGQGTGVRHGGIVLDAVEAICAGIVRMVPVSGTKEDPHIPGTIEGGGWGAVNPLGRIILSSQWRVGRRWVGDKQALARPVGHQTTGERGWR